MRVVIFLVVLAACGGTNGNGAGRIKSACDHASQNVARVIRADPDPAIRAVAAAASAQVRDQCGRLTVDGLACLSDVEKRDLAELLLCDGVQLDVR